MYIVSTTILTEEMRERLKANFPSATFVFYENIEQAEVDLPKADIIVTYGEDLIAFHIEQAEQLKWIMVISAGMDEMPFRHIKARGIKVTNAKGIHKIQMAEYAISMLLHVYRQNETFRRNQLAQKWDQTVPFKEISNRTMTIVGSGVIGEELARIAKAFRMKTIGVSRSGEEKAQFDEVYTTDHLELALKQADFVVSILPSTADTLYFYKQDHFKAMKPNAIFLNMGRGDAVQSETLIMALDQEQIAHAILDVFEQEPLPSDHPLWEHPKVTMTPHVSGKSPNYIPRAIDIFEQNLRSYLNNRELCINVIDPDRGY
ncbi:Glyoxylate/hydroxypyruvate reductase A [Paraliobacillus sp. PM-2]|uniref:D-2-hydroxyacid dehydrogenase n=1 Tax=Paraliobacillus sp. PM-2 TaxID=1462524 RepID=UPI00061C264C|nr:D-2-hydroxyacid dehydrogenase [Paraliobacillus sp. PM-2]CQR47202.1 Glyoxylate/hydroxypyruvate reductase A [Paraliobacillus sp. PM-2]